MRKPLLLMPWAIAALLLLHTAAGLNEFDDDITFDDVPTRPDGPGRPPDTGISSYISRTLSRIKRGWFDDFLGTTPEEVSPSSTTKDDVTTTTPSSVLTSSPADEISHRETRSTQPDSGTTNPDRSSRYKESDDEDIATASGSGAEWETPKFVHPSHSSDPYAIFRIKIYVQEFWTTDMDNKQSSAFDKFAKNFTRELEQFFDAPVGDDPALPGSRRATVIGIAPSKDDTMLVLVTSDLGSKGYNNGDEIRSRLLRHLTTMGRMGMHAVRIDKNHPLTVQQFTEPNLSGFSSCESDQLVCNDGVTCLGTETRCDGRSDCPDGEDEEGCPFSENSDTQPTSGATPSLNARGSSLERTSSLGSAPPRCDDTKLCPDGVTPICADMICDGTKDCPGISEEDSCPNEDGSGPIGAPTPTVPLPTSEETPNCLIDEFMCDVTRCISSRKKCDGDKDCDDGTDEDDCPRERCGPGDFRCRNLKCIRYYQRCDRISDCDEGEDEENCPCSSGEFQCDDGKCIELSLKCNREADCSDGSDERDCDKESLQVCNDSEFNCGDVCIDRTFVCDLQPDCANGADEIDCQPSCDFRCKSEGKCVNSWDLCDGFKQCTDGSDEENCVACNPPDFKCSNGTCIPANLKCNGRNDCAGGEDEREPECPSGSTACLEGEFACNNGQCIHKQYLCDTIPDCLDRSDEDEVTCRVSCMEDDFHCVDSGKCIRSGQRCDGTRHCDDGSDERDCPRVCAYTEYECANGVCIEASQRCNGKQECSDGSDEDGCRESGILPKPYNLSVSMTPGGSITYYVGQTLDFTCHFTSPMPVTPEIREVHSYPSLTNEFPVGAALNQLRYSTRGEINVIVEMTQDLIFVECVLIDESGQEVARAQTTTRTTAASCDPYSQFTCDNGQCVSKSAKCNNVEDCADGSDEGNCILNEIQLVTNPNSQEIAKGKEAVFQCRDEGPSRYRVNWVRGDGQGLPPGSRTHNNGARLEIPNVQLSATGAYVCEAVGAPRSAAGARTTVYLTVLPSIHIPEDTSYPEITCRYDEATCYNRQCIKKSQVCDGNIDCTDGSDESRCSVHHVCEANMFMCDNRECVMKTWRCDNQKDCLDGSDEKGCDVSKNGTCYTTEFACRSGDQCIPRGMLCDKQKDCYDNSDEIGCKDPEIVLPPKAIVRLVEGEELILTCRAIGFPIPIINWRLNWGHVPKKCRMINEAGLGSLICPDMRNEDSGAYSCEAINGKSKFAIPDANVIVRSSIRPPGPVCPAGTFNEIAQSREDCIKCFCFGRTTDCRSANLYSYKLPAPRNTFPLVLARFEPNIEINPGFSPVRNYPTPSGNGFEIHSPVGGNGSMYNYYSMPEDTHGNQLKSYGGFITYKVVPGGNTRRPYIDIPDVVIQGNNRTLTHRIRSGLARDRENEVSVRIFEGEWQVTSPSEDLYNNFARREDIMMALADVENILIRAQYIEGPGIDTVITDINMDSADVTNTGGAKAAYVEQCSCPRGYTGNSCEKCSNGFLRQPGAFLGICSEVAPPIGPCPPGTYGAPRRGIGCRPCPCPLSNFPGSYGTCELGPANQPICNCRDGYVGERCQQCDRDRGYSGDARVGGCRKSECNDDGSLTPYPLSDGTCDCKPYTTGSRCDQCVQESFFLSAKNQFGCIKCFCMGITRDCASSQLYRDSIETRFYGSSPQEFSLVKKNADDQFEKITPIVDPSTRELYFDNFDTEVYYWALSPAYLFDKVTSYGGNLQYTIRYTPSPGGMSSKNSAADVEIRSSNRITLSHFSRQNIEPEQTVTVTVPLLEQHWQGEFGQSTDREHLLQALADISGIYIKATYTTSTSRASLISVSLDTATNRNTGRPKALEVEQCACPQGYVGTSCEDCAPGYKRTEDGLYLRLCERCDCGGHSDDCDADTGACRNCRGNRIGEHCERCAPGFTLTSDGICAPKADCSCDPRGTTGCPYNRCECKVNVEGEYCDRCRPGTFHLSADNEMGCSECYCSEVTSECQSSTLFMEQVPVPILDNNHGFTLSDGSSTVIRDGFKPNFAMSEIGYKMGWRPERLYWSLPSRVTGDKVLSYGGTIAFSQRYTTNSGDSEPTSDHDIIINGNGNSIFYTIDELLRADSRRDEAVRISAGKWRILDQRNGNPIASRQDILKVLSNVNQILIRASLATNIEDTYISDVVLETASQNTYGPRAEQVEVCRCPPEYKGTSCQNCASGYYRHYDNTCKRCPCVHGTCSQGSDYEVKCNCESGWQGDRCEEPVFRGSISITMTPAGRLRYSIGSYENFRCEYNSTVPVRVEIHEVFTHKSYRLKGGLQGLPEYPVTAARRMDPPRMYGEIDKTIRILERLSTVECILLDDLDKIVGKTQAFIEVTPDDEDDNPPPPASISVDISVSPSGYIPDGTRVTLTCRAEANSREPVSIIWSKRGGRLPRVIDDGRGRMTIVSAHSSDSGVYLCTANTRNSSETKSIIITVDEQKSPPARPQIRVYPSSTIEALAGREVSIQCNSLGYPLPEIEWNRIDGRGFSDEADLVGGNLKIRTATKADEGQYECRATNPSGYDSVIVTIYVRDAEPVGSLIIVPREINAIAGQTITISCVLEPSSDSITLEWKRNDRREFPGKAEVYGGNLTIRDIGPYDAGQYVCTATSSSSGYKVSEANAYIRVSRGPRSLRVTIVPERVTVDEYDTAVMTCNSSIPDAQITWTKLVDDRRSPLRRKAQMYDNVLRIPNVEMEDRAVYVCEAKYRGVTAKARGYLEVKRRGITPLIELSERSLTVMEGKSAYVECRPSGGSPPPRVSWSKRDSPLPRNIVQENNLLRVNVVQLSDAGDYICTAENSAGKTTAVLRLDVQTRPRIRVNPQGTVKLAAGDSLLLNCRATGVPAPSVKWEIRSALVASSRPETTSETGQAQVEIYRLSPEDSGYYTCRASSPAGEAEESVYVQVTTSDGTNEVNPDETPENREFEIDLGGATEITCSHSSRDPDVEYTWSRRDGRGLGRSVTTDGERLLISNAELSDSGDYVCEIRDRNGYSQTSNIATIKVIEKFNIRLKPETQVVHPNDDAFIMCEVVGEARAVDITWEGVDRSLPRSAIVNGGRITFKRIQPEDAGRYSCIAVDPVTLYSVKALARVTVKPRPNRYRIRSSAIKAKGKFSTIAHCLPPEKFLCHNGVQCLDAAQKCDRVPDCSDRSDEENCPYYRIRYDLFPKHFDRGDQPPTVRVVGDKNLTKTEGTSLFLQCVVSDTPNAKIEWTKQGDNLPNNADTRDNNLMISNLYPADSGVYICTATSRTGVQGFDRVTLNVEQGCTAQNKIACKDGKTCYSSSQICDTKYDCPDGEDEMMCSRRKRNHGVVTARVYIEPSVDRIRVGESVDLRCNAIGVFATEHPQWEKVGGGIDDNVLIRDNVLRIHDVTTDNAGLYRCWVKKLNGQIVEDQYMLEVQADASSQSDRPRTHPFVKRLAEKTKTVRVYESVDIECDAGLEPPVTFIWTKRNGLVLANQTGSKIHLNNVLPSDAGEYLCIASNSELKIEFPTFLVVKGTIPRFTQQSVSFLKLKPMAAYLKFDLLLSIKPERPNGLILYNGEKTPPNNKDFLALGLKNGHVEFRFDVGSGVALISSNITIPMGKWSNITLKRERKEGRLWVNGNGPFIGTSPGRYQGLDLTEPMYLGAVPNFTAISHSVGFDTGFVGCISYLKINDLEEDLSKALERSDVSDCDTCSDSNCRNNGVCQETPNERGYQCLCPRGFTGRDCLSIGGTSACYHGLCNEGKCINTQGSYRCQCRLGTAGENCELKIKVNTPHFEGDSFLAYPIPHTTSDFSLSLEAKLDDTRNSLLAYSSQTQSGNGDFIALVVRDQQVEFTVDTGAGPETIRNAHRLSPGTWVKIFAEKRADELSLSVNGDLSDKVLDARKTRAYKKGLNLHTPLYLGGYDDSIVSLHPSIYIKDGIMGCIKSLRINGRPPTNLIKNAVESSNVGQCAGAVLNGDINSSLRDDLCGEQRCQNNGNCDYSDGEPVCACTSDFGGAYCEIKTNQCGKNPNPCGSHGICHSDSTSSEGYRCDCFFGFLGPTCQEKNSITTEVAFRRDSYIELPGHLTKVWRPEEEVSVSMAVQTEEPIGLIFWQGTDGQYMSIGVRDGFIEAEVDHNDNPLTIRSRTRVDDARPHNLTVSRKASDLEITLDGVTVASTNGQPPRRMSSRESIFIGGLPDPWSMTNGRWKETFVGCILRLRINHGEPLDFSKHHISGRNVKSCLSSEFLTNNETK